MASAEEIKELLPNWPEDVIEQWLVPHSEREELGWPPPDNIQESGWYYVLSEKNLDWWGEVEWRQLNLIINFQEVSETDRHIADQLLRFVIRDEQNNYSNLGNSKIRVGNVLRYLKENGGLPKPPIAVMHESGLRFIDGSHRISALLFYQSESSIAMEGENYSPPDEVHAVWVGTHRSGEVLG